MKQLRLVGAIALGLLVLGCGGNVSQTSVSAGGPVVPAIVGNPTIEMTTFGGFIPITVPTYADSLNIRTSEQTQFQLVGYTAAGDRLVLPATDWRVSDTTNTFGTISSNTGVFTASSRQTASSQLVSARYNGREYTTDYVIKPRQARIIGMLVSESNGLPIRNAILYFYNDLGVFLGEAKTVYDGTFKASVSSTVARFQIVSDTLPAGFQRKFKFDTTLPVSLSRPAFFNNLNSSGAVVPITVPNYGPGTNDTGTNNALSLIGSTLPTFNADYYMNGPILVP